MPRVLPRVLPRLMTMPRLCVDILPNCQKDDNEMLYCLANVKLFSETYPATRSPIAIPGTKKTAVARLVYIFVVHCSSNSLIIVLKIPSLYKCTLPKIFHELFFGFKVVLEYRIGKVFRMYFKQISLHLWLPVLVGPLPRISGEATNVVCRATPVLTGYFWHLNLKKGQFTREPNYFQWASRA